MPTPTRLCRIGISYTEETIQALHGHRELAVKYLKAALAKLDSPENRAAGLLALHDIVEAYGGIGAIAAVAVIRQESLYRMLSPKGNPTLKTLYVWISMDRLRLRL